MRLSQQKLFDQLEQRRKATTYAFRPVFPERPSVHPRGTLAHFADQIGRTSEALIAQFADAGLPGLTPSLRLLEEHKEQLLDYLRAKHSAAAVLYEEQEPNPLSLVVVQDITAEIVAHLAREPQLLYQLAPRKFEELVAKLLEQQGCDVTLTKATRDGGYDILGRVKHGPASLLFLAECKRYAPENKVGVEVVRGLYGVTEIQKANYGLIITTSTFTRDAKEETLRIGPRIQLAEYDDLCSWLASTSRGGA
jgi:restriction endonuclease Mrr